MLEAAIRLQTLEEVDYLDPFQLRFRLGLSIEMPLVMLVNDLRWSQDEIGAFMLVFLDLSAVFHTIHHSILWG